MIFENVITGETLAHVDFVAFIWTEAERQFEECHENEQWCNLSKMEQIEQYCEQFEHHTNDGDWIMN